MAATATAGTSKAKGKLHPWRRGVERATRPDASLGGILGRNGTYFLTSGAGERVSFV